MQSCFEHDCFLQSTSYTTTFEHAVGIQTQFSQPLYGMLTFMPVYEPEVFADGEHNVSQLWVQTGQCENWYNSPPNPNQCNTGNGVQNQAVQSLETGWAVQAPNGEATLLAFITQDGYYSYCYAGYGQDCCNVSGQSSDCFVAATGSPYVVNEVLSPSGGPDGQPPTNELALQVWNGSASNPAYPGWWIWVNGKLLGWYPPDTFIWPNSNPQSYGPMSYGPATYLQVGGEVLDVWPNQEHTQTQMGSGYAPGPETGYGWAAYDRNINWMNYTGAYASTQLEFFSAPSCEGDYGVPGLCGAQSGWFTNNDGSGYGAYSVMLSGQPSGVNWGNYFYFGGGEFQCFEGGPTPCVAP